MTLNISFPAISDWDAAYSNRDAVANVREWRADAEAAAAAFGRTYAGRIERDISFGSRARERLDVFHPHGAPRGTVIFIHGGYWRASTKETHWHFAQGLLAHDWRVVFVEYPLCPAVSIADITQSVKRAFEHIAQKFPSDRIILCGHSAGGHLATWLGAEIGGLGEDILSRIERIVSLSGLHDLRPLVATTELNADLRLDPSQAAQLSPALSRPAGSFDLVCVAGAAELPEFRRQSLLLANIWSGLGLPTRAAEIPDANHYSLLDGLTKPDSALTSLVLP